MAYFVRHAGNMPVAFIALDSILQPSNKHEVTAEANVFRNSYQCLCESHICVESSGSFVMQYSDVEWRMSSLA